MSNFSIFVDELADSMVVKKRRKLKEREFIEKESLLKFIEFLVFHIVLTLAIIEVMIRSEGVDA